ncbi:hypothetical protein CR983_03960 [Candidatus Saccharibacteria bacterium]|nr:MAG: hypothetical protein CR983_03960 [Candidatus Saccharibacteria bacterium]
MGTHTAQTKRLGFTLIELLVVMLVIAILAAISVASYQGITERAHKSTIESDMASAIKKIEVYRSRTGLYPEASGQQSAVGMRFSFSPVGKNIILCADNADQQAGFAIVARYPYGPQWYVHESTKSELLEVTPANESAAGLCATTSHPAMSWGSEWVVGS